MLYYRREIMDLPSELKITDDLVLASPLILAPMSGVTDAAFRSLIFKENEIGIGMMVTEFVSVEALTRKNQRCAQMMKFQQHERPISIQIFGYDVDRMVQAAEMAEEAGADMLDINCGCPVPKVVRRGGGAELMRQPEHLRKIISAIKRTVKIPIGVKIRAGWDEAHKNAIEIAKLAEDEGAGLLTIHARTKVQGYSGKIDYAIVERVCGEISIPVVGSGDIYDIQGVKFYFDLGAKGAMIGRAALKNPWIFKDIFCAICGKKESSGFNVPPEQIISPKQSGLTGQAIVLKKDAECQEENFEEQAEIKYAAVVRVLTDYSLLLRNNSLSENAVLGRLKQLVAQVTKGQVGGTKLRAALCKAKTVEQFFEELKGNL